jgi:undecaprenyl-diphosphatase
MDLILELDTKLFLAINGWHNETWDGLMWWVSGKTTWWPFYLLLIGYMGWRKRWQLLPILFFIILVILLTDQTAVHLFKNLFHRLRPCHEPALQGIVHLVNNRCGGLYGFISSHAANTFGVALLSLLWMRDRWFSLVMVTWALLVSYSRVYLGVHYPGDVLIGGIWGAGCGWSMFLLYRWVISKLPASWWVVGVPPENKP